MPSANRQTLTGLIAVKSQAHAILFDFRLPQSMQIAVIRLDMTLLSYAPV